MTRASGYISIVAIQIAHHHRVGERRHFHGSSAAGPEYAGERLPAVLGCDPAGDRRRLARIPAHGAGDGVDQPPLHLPYRTRRQLVEGEGSDVVRESCGGLVHNVFLWKTYRTRMIRPSCGCMRESQARTCFITRHVCDGGDVGCRSRRRARSNMSILRGLPTKRCAQSAPSLRVAARAVVYCVTLLDHIDIWPSSGALYTVRPGHNAARAWL